MKVYYSGGFCGHHNQYERAGKEILLNAAFEYGGYEWRVPAAYSCGKGLVLDILRRIPAEKFRFFYEKWKDVSEEKPDREERELAEHENPMEFPATFELEVNGCKLKAEGWSGSGWYGSLWQGTDEAAREAKIAREAETAGEAATAQAVRRTEPELQALQERYGFSETEAWYCVRARFPWTGSRKPEIRTLVLTIGTRKESCPCGAHIFAEEGCEPFSKEIVHPLTGEKLTLHVLSCRENEISEESLPGNRLADENDAVFRGLIVPRKFHILEYRSEPALPEGEVLWLRDCGEGDSPIRRTTETAAEAGMKGAGTREKGAGTPENGAGTPEKGAGTRGKAAGAAAIGVIGGSSGPTAVFAAGSPTALPAPQAVCSSMHFESFSGTEWYVSVRKAPFPPMRVTLKEGSHDETADGK